MTTDERIKKLEKAQELLIEASHLIEEAVSGTGVERNVHAYLLDTLNDSAGGEGCNEYNQSVGQVIDLLRRQGT